jgi:hypothetical protein
MSRIAAWLVTLFAVVPPPALADAPIRVIEDSLVVPAGLDAADALAAVEDLGAIFALYEPVIPWIPGVKLHLHKEILSVEGPVVMALPVHGAAFGRRIEERARVTASTEPMICNEGNGVRITLDFDASSRNIERRIDRIEITACPRTEQDGAIKIDVTGALYEGDLPRDPSLNAFNESIGANALQTAFLKQVPAVFDAVVFYWAEQTG